MDTFPIVKRKDEAAFGSYRTKELILRGLRRHAGGHCLRSSVRIAP